MILLCVLITLTPFCYCQNAEIGFPKTCYIAGEALTIEAVYTGTGTPQLVTWTYSGSSQVVVETTGCSRISSVPAGFPDASRLSFKCVTTDVSLLANTYKLIVTGLQTDELDKTWAVTFTPPVGAAPAAVQSPVPSDCSSCKCDCEGCKTRVGICISFSCIGIIAPEVIFVVGLFIASFSKTKLVVFAAIVIVIEIIGGGVCISVPMEKCCIECCENWYKPPSIGFAVVSFLVGVAGIAEFVLVLSNRIGPGRNGGNGFFCFNNGNDDGNDGGNDSGNNGHHRGRGTNSSTVHTERADTHRGTLSDRTKKKEKGPLEKLANSDGEVSRKDVHVQENRDNFSGRPMPPIPPLTDKKGRGLSANYDDDHPMTSVGIPDKKAGQLVPLKEQKEQKKKEESKKRRKRKKKAVSDDDDDDDVV